METFHAVAAAINNVLWHNWVLYIVLGTGVLFTVWSVFGQYRALTHGTAVTLGRYDNPNDPGAINHFQALSTALSATVGLGNIGGVAIAIGLGGPGALFWMWVVGVFGMAIKMTEVTLSMLYRNVDDPDEPHGGPMWVAKKAFAEMGPKYVTLGKIIGGIFCITLLTSAITGGNMFQAWNVADVTNEYFHWPQWLVGVILATVVGLVIIGGIKRIGNVTGILVPFMCAIYVIAGLYVIALNIADIPAIFGLIFHSAFNPTESAGAFVGGTAGMAFLWGMKRALFSSEAGQGSSPIAHSAAKTDEPVREGIVAGLEPFIDTIVVCTITGLVLISSGVWNRDAEGTFDRMPAVEQAADNTWQVATTILPATDKEGGWRDGENIFMVYSDGAENGVLQKLNGNVEDRNGTPYVNWNSISSDSAPQFRDGGVYGSYTGASLTALAFNQTHPWLGKWLVTLAAWLFAISTIIAWGYYGEQGIVYLFGQRGILPYKVIYCGLVVVTTLGFIQTDAELDAITSIGTGVMLFANIPLTLFFGHKAMRAYKDYIRRFKAGEMVPEHPDVDLTDVITGKDVEKEED